MVTSLSSTAFLKFCIRDALALSNEDCMRESTSGHKVESETSRLILILNFLYLN